MLDFDALRRKFCDKKLHELSRKESDAYAHNKEDNSLLAKKMIGHQNQPDRINSIVRHVASKSMCIFVMILPQISEPNASDILGIYSNVLIMLARSYRVWNKKKDVCRYRMWMGLLLRTFLGWLEVKTLLNLTNAPHPMRYVHIYRLCSQIVAGLNRDECASNENLIAQSKTYYHDLLRWWRGADRIAHVKNVR